MIKIDSHLVSKFFAIWMRGIWAIVSITVFLASIMRPETVIKCEFSWFITSGWVCNLGCRPIHFNDKRGISLPFTAIVSSVKVQLILWTTQFFHL